MAQHGCASGIAAADAWLGVAIDDGAGASLFGDHRDLAVAGRDEIAMSDPEGADGVLPELLRRGRLAARRCQGPAAGGLPAGRGAPV